MIWLRARGGAMSIRDGPFASGSTGRTRDVFEPYPMVSSRQPVAHTPVDLGVPTIDTLLILVSLVHRNEDHYHPNAGVLPEDSIQGGYGNDTLYNGFDDDQVNAQDDQRDIT